MCIDLDLFGQVIVRKSEVNFWLDHVCHMSGKIQLRREQYARTHDIANKIIKSKLSGEFAKLISDFENAAEYNNQDIEFFATKYAEPWSRKPCPNHWHICAFMDCDIFLKRRKSLQNAIYYQNKKKKAAKAAFPRNTTKI